MTGIEEQTGGTTTHCDKPSGETAARPKADRIEL
jgi:hypothetical protein